MKEVQLSQGKIAIVDDEDYEYLMQWCWNTLKTKCTSYAQRKTRISENGIPRKVVLMHRAIMELHNFNLLDLDVDHKDGNGLNNQKVNLRAVTHRQNCQNKQNGKILTSSYPGVSWCGGRTQKWRAFAFFEGKHRSIGSYKTEKLAFEAYKNKLANLNETVIEEII